MAAVNPHDIAYAAPVDARGDLPLEPRIADGGVKVFDLEASVTRWNILPGTAVAAYAFNHDGRRYAERLYHQRQGLSGD